MNPKAGLADTTREERLVYSVSELTRNIRFLLERHFASVWVEGEIGDCKRHSSGHVYLTLKDGEAQLQCVLFRREGASLAFEPREGLQVLARGRVSVYPVRGQYQLYLDRLEPKGLGALQLRFKQLCEKLEKEGLFDAGRKRPIPFLPGTVAVVTSTDGAALRDILQVLGRRFPAAHVRIYPVPVQGEGAGARIAEAVEDLNRWSAADVMILARGGGSLEDLWAFNEEALARAIAASGIPVVSAVGHETDFTIADFVADLRAPTPSAAAELVLPLQEEMLLRVRELALRASQAALSQVRTLKQALDALKKTRALRDPLWYLGDQRQRLDELRKALAAALSSEVLRKKGSVAGLAGKLDALGPLATLSRGFGISFRLPEEKVLTGVGKLAPGDQIRTRLADGSFTATVVSVEKKKR